MSVRPDGRPQPEVEPIEEQNENSSSSEENDEDSNSSEKNEEVSEDSDLNVSNDSVESIDEKEDQTNL